VYTNR